MRRLLPPEAVSRLLGERKPLLDGDRSALRNRTGLGMARPGGLNGRGPAEPSYMKKRTAGHIGNDDLRRHARRLVRSVCAGSESRGRLTSGMPRSSPARFSMACCGSAFCTTSRSSGKGPHGTHANALLVPARTVLVRAQEERSLVRQGRRELDDLGFAVAEVHHGRIGRGEVRSSDAEAGGTDAASRS